MGTGQMMLTIGAMLLLSTVILKMNSSISTTDNFMITNKIAIMALSKARSVIEEASGRNFDENINTTFTASSFTDESNFGKDGLESYPRYDDFDDFVSLSADSNIVIQSIPFQVNVAVDYVDLVGGVIQHSNIKTFHKRMNVAVTSPFMLKFDNITQDTVYMTSFKSYW